MTRYNSEANEAYVGVKEGYREGVERVLEYIESIHLYDGLVMELRWAITEGIV